MRFVCGYTHLSSGFRGRDHGIDFHDVTVRHAIPLILVANDFAEGFEIVERNDRKFGPFRVRLKPGLELPFAGVSRDTDQTNLTFVSVLTPFVFLHDLWSLKVRDSEVAAP